MYNHSFRFGFAFHPTHLNFPFEWNKDNNYSCSIQLTSDTDRLIAYYFWSWPKIVAQERLYVGTLLPRSTCSVTVTVKPKEPPRDGDHCLYISACIVKEDVKAEDITMENFRKISSPGKTFLGIIYYTVPSANSCSPEDITMEKETGFVLLNDDNNDLLHQAINDEIHGTTSKDKGSESSVRRQLSNEMPRIVMFTAQEIKDATNGLNSSSKIGQGGYGAVYKGIFHDTEVAIKMLDPKSQQGIDEFLREMVVLARMRYTNLVKLIGACVHIRALVYEFFPHGSLGDCLQKNPEILTWQMRTRIVYEICSALTFLHSIKPQPVVHGDLKPANILLDVNYISKLADFGLCRFIPEGTASIAFLETMPKGTVGYIDPKFMKTGILTPDCDLYSFGVTILKLLTGMDTPGIVTKVRSAKKEKSLMTMVDPTAGHWPVDVSDFLAHYGLECCATRKSPGLLQEIASDLKEILTVIG